MWELCHSMHAGRILHVMTHVFMFLSMLWHMFFAFQHAAVHLQRAHMLWHMFYSQMHAATHVSPSVAWSDAYSDFHLHVMTHLCSPAHAMTHISRLPNMLWHMFACARWLAYSLVGSYDCMLWHMFPKWTCSDTWSIRFCMLPHIFLLSIHTTSHLASC